MAVNTVSTATGNPWQTIATNTPTSGTTVTFSSIAGYKTLMLAFNNVTTASAAGYGKITFNGSGSNYVATYLTSYVNNSSSSNSYIPLDSAQTYNNKYAGYIIINDVLNSIPKTITGISWDNYTSQAGNVTGVWNDTSVLTSITLTSTGTAFSGSNTGTVTLYGIAA
jgi:hypothetical protein